MERLNHHHIHIFIWKFSTNPSPFRASMWWFEDSNSPNHLVSPMNSPAKLTNKTTTHSDSRSTVGTFHHSSQLIASLHHRSQPPGRPRNRVVTSAVGSLRTRCGRCGMSGLKKKPPDVACRNRGSNPVACVKLLKNSGGKTRGTSNQLSKQVQSSTWLRHVQKGCHSRMRWTTCPEWGPSTPAWDACVGYVGWGWKTGRFPGIEIMKPGWFGSKKTIYASARLVQGEHRKTVHKTVRWFGALAA